jgi:hypothetical protein
MRPVDRTATPSGSAFGPRRRPISAPSGEAEAPGRALIAFPVTPAEPARPSGRVGASFLAHLIATDRQLPQTRERRRGEPAEAIAAYAGVRERPVGRTLRLA